MKNTIIITSWNRPILLRQAIESCLNQTHSDLEIFIADDGSTQEVREIIYKYLKLDDRLIYYQSGRKEKDRLKSTEFAENINICLGIATGGSVCYLTDDDYYLPEHIKLLTKALEQNSKWMAVYGPQMVVSHSDKTMKDRNRFIRAPGTIVYHAPCQLDHNQIMHRMSIIEKIGVWPTDLCHRGACDAQYWLKINKYWPVYRATDTVTNVHRLHKNSIQGLE